MHHHRTEMTKPLAANSFDAAKRQKIELAVLGNREAE